MFDLIYHSSMENLLFQPQYQNHLKTIVITTDANNQCDWYNGISEVLMPLLFSH